MINSKYSLIWCRVSLFIKTTPVNPRSINTAAFNKMKAYDSIESAEGDCRTLSKMMQVTYIAHRHSFRCYRNGLESRELKTLYLSDQNNQKIQNNGCQYEINEKIQSLVLASIPSRYRSAFAFMNTPIGSLLQSEQ